MRIEGKYLLVSYRDIPDIDFICETGSDLRIRVSKVLKTELSDLTEGVLSAVVDGWILVFENVSNRIISEQDEFMRAVRWYKARFGLRTMNLLYL